MSQPNNIQTLGQPPSDTTQQQAVAGPSLGQGWKIAGVVVIGIVVIAVIALKIWVIVKVVKILNKAAK